MNISKDNINGVKNLPGVNLTSCIVPCTEKDKYPTHDSTYGKGGWREVYTIEERNAIPMERRKIGMAVRVTSTNKTYILKYAINNYCWYEENPTDVSDIINDAISRGEITVDFTGCVTQDNLSEALAEYIKTEDCNAELEELETSLKNWVLEQNYLTEHQSLEDCATKAEVIEGFQALNEELEIVQGDIINIEEEIEQIKQDHADYVESNDAEIAKIKEDIVELSEALGGTEEISFATKEELQEVADKEIADFEALSKDLEEVKKDYVTKIDAILTYATNDALEEAKSELKTALGSYAKLDDISTLMEKTGYITKSYLRGYATEFYVQDYVASAMSGKIKPGQPLVDYSAEINELKKQVAELTNKLNELLS